MQCIGDLATKLGVSYLLIARAMPSQVATQGVMMQVLVLHGASHRIKRNADMEVAVAEDVPTALRAQLQGELGDINQRLPARCVRDHSPHTPMPHAAAYH